MPVYSAAVPEAPLLVAFGVVTHHTRGQLRQAARVSWMRSLPADMHARFVLPAVHVEEDATGAAAAFGDELRRHPNEFALLNGSASHRWGEAARALVALDWFRCATRIYPLAPYVGRACDSTWLNGRGVGLMLRATLPWLRRPYEAVIGRLHAFVRPSNGSGGAPTPAQWCAERAQPDAAQVEPSLLTARNLLLDGCLLLSSGGAPGALAHRIAKQMPAAPSPLSAAELSAEIGVGATALVYMSDDIYVSGWGFRVTQTALAYAPMAEAPLRIAVAEHWSRANYCGADLPRISCDHRRLSGSCASGPIFPCYAGRLPGCSVGLVDLWGYAREVCRNDSALAHMCAGHEGVL